MPDQSLDILIKMIADLGGADAAIAKIREMSVATADLNAQTRDGDSAAKSAIASALKGQKLPPLPPLPPQPNQPSPTQPGGPGANEAFLAGLAEKAMKLGTIAGAYQILKHAAGEYMATEQAVIRLKGQGLAADEAEIATIKQIATLLNTDLTGATQVYVRASNGMTRELKANGIEVDANADKATRLAQIRSGVSEKAAEIAKAREGTLTGALKETEKAYNDLLETMGKRLVKEGSAPAVLGGFAVWLKHLNELMGETEKKGEAAGGGIEFIGEKALKMRSVGVGALDAMNAALDKTIGKIGEVLDGENKIIAAEAALRAAETEAAGGDETQQKKDKLDADEADFKARQTAADNAEAEIKKQQKAVQTETEATQSRQDELNKKAKDAHLTVQESVEYADLLAKQASADAAAAMGGVVNQLTPEEAQRLGALSVKSGDHESEADKAEQKKNAARLSQLNEQSKTLQEQLDKAKATSAPLSIERQTLDVRQRALTKEAGEKAIIGGAKSQAEQERDAQIEFSREREGAGKITPRAAERMRENALAEFEASVKAINERASEIMRGIGQGLQRRDEKWMKQLQELERLVRNTTR